MAKAIVAAELCGLLVRWWPSVWRSAGVRACGAERRAARLLAPARGTRGLCGEWVVSCADTGSCWGKCGRVLVS